MPPAGSPVSTSSRASRWVPPLLWAALILVGTSWPSINVGPDVGGLDKVAHFGMYAVLARLVLGAQLSPRNLATTITVVLLVSALGAGDEWHQMFIRGRSASFPDWIADTCGAIAGVLSVHLIPSLVPWRQGAAS